MPETIPDSFPATLEGGPGCGQEIPLEWPPPTSILIELDPAENDGLRKVCSYEFAARTTSDGKRWVYVYDRFVGIRGMKGGKA